MTPDWIPIAHRAHTVGMAFGSALLVILVRDLYRSGLNRRYPAFFAYIVIACARAIQGFVGISDGWYLLSETATMVAKAGAVLEGAVLLFPRPRVPTLAVLAGLAAILGGVALLLPAEPNPVREFERIRTASHIGLAALTAAGCGWLWRRPRDVNPYALAYWRIWTFRLVCMAALGFINYQAWPEEWRWTGYYLWAAGFLISGYMASILWLQWAKRFSP